jgi:lysophospholipase L1-like esterase
MTLPRPLGVAVRLSFCAFLLLMLACGGGGNSPGSGPVTGTPPPHAAWDMVALGDSLAVGVAAGEGYVPRYANMIATDTGHAVNIRNFGVLGWKSGDLLAALRSDAPMRDAIQHANVVVWDIGGNDLLSAHTHFLRGDCGGSDNLECFRNAVTRFRTNWDDIVAEILALRSAKTTVIRTMDVYNPFVSEDRLGGNFQQLNQFLEQVDEHIHTSAAANGIPVADVHAAFNGADSTEDPESKGYLAVDHVHPNDTGHRVIAEQLRNLGYAPLQ